MPGRGDYGKREAKKPKKDPKKSGLPVMGGPAAVPAEVEVVRTKGKKAKGDW